MKKEFVWEIEGYTGSVFADNLEQAERKVKNMISIQEVEND